MMRTLPVRLPAIIVLIVSAVGAVFFAGSPASTSADNTSTTWIEIETPPEVLAAVAARGKVPAQQIPLQTDVTVVSEGFESEEFPPPGWLYGISGVPDTPEFQWGRETCDVDDRIAGNTAAAWSTGGGTGGDALACGAAYTQPVTAYLLTGPYDARGLVGGVQLAWRSNHNIPSDRGQMFPFGICILLSSNSVCSVPSESQTPGWATYRSEPFLEAAGLEEVSFYMLYRDEAPTGTHTGAFVDDVNVIGLTAPVVPTPTQPPRTAPPPPPGDRAVSLPVAWKSSSKGDLPDVTPAAPGAGVAFGMGLTGTGSGSVALDARLIDSGIAFQYGQPRICTRVTWWGQALNTPLRWEWYQDGAAIAPGNTDVNPSFPVATRRGSAGNCLVAADTNGSAVPIPRGTYEVRVFLGNVRQAAGTALIHDGPPPGATGIPTAYPTIAASPTPMETPTDGCRTTLVNGDFERGPSVAWRWAYSHVIPGRTVADVIRNNINVSGGMWAAQLGGIIVQGAQFAEELSQDSSPTGLVDPARITSATLKFSSGMVTNETRNGTNDDVFFAAFVSRQDATLVEIVGAYSEESITPGSYNRYEVDVKAEMTRRTNWDQSILAFQGVQNDVDGSFFYLDDVELEVCRTEGAPPSRDRGARPQDARAWNLLRPAIDNREDVRIVVPSGEGSTRPFSVRSDTPWMLPTSHGKDLPGASGETSGVRLMAAPVR